MNTRVGAREHYFMYHGPDAWNALPWEFGPANGKPPAVLRQLVKKRWMWAERIEIYPWMPLRQEWGGRLSGPLFRCGLTDKGLEIIKARRQAALNTSAHG